MEDNLQLMQPTAVVAEAEMTLEQFQSQVQVAATRIQSGINMIWDLGQRAVRMAYGASPHAAAFVLCLLNDLPADAARQTHDWLKKAGITVNRPMPNSKLYWLSDVERKIDGKDVKLITSKKPGEDGFGFAKEKALLYVKTTPPMAIEKKDAKPKGVKVLEGLAADRARKALEKTHDRLKKDDPIAANILNDAIGLMGDMKSAFYDATGQRQALDEKEVKLVDSVMRCIANNDANLDTLLKVLSGEYEVALTPL